MSVNPFRRIATTLTEVVEGTHMQHPDFRVRGKIFATLWPGESKGVVMLTPEQQQLLIEAEPKIFSPASGAWGEKGATVVLIEHADDATLRSALTMAWRNKAPKSLAAPDLPRVKARKAPRKGASKR